MESYWTPLSLSNAMDLQASLQPRIEAPPRTFSPGKSAYDILGVSRDTTPTDVEKAYRRKCLKWHPDKWQTHLPEEQKKAEDTFKDIGLCRDILRGTSATPAPTRDPG